MLDFTDRIKELKLENDDLVNFDIRFYGSEIRMSGELIENGKSEGFYGAGSIAHFFIPTDKGYVSAKWKKTELYKSSIEDGLEVTDLLLNELEPFLQSSSPNHFVRKTEGWGAAGAVANHINSKVDYASNKMRQ